MSDVPRPFKKSLPAYTEHEEKLLAMIYERFLGSPITPEEERKVKEIDDDLLWFDLTYLLNERPDAPEPRVHIDVSYKVRPFEDVEKEYIAVYDELKTGL